MINFTKKIGDTQFQLKTNAGNNLEEMVEIFGKESVYDLALAKWIIVCQTAVGTAAANAEKEGIEFTNEDAQDVVESLKKEYRRGKKADPIAKIQKLLAGLPDDVRADLMAQYSDDATNEE